MRFGYVCYYLVQRARLMLTRKRLPWTVSVSAHLFLLVLLMIAVPTSTSVTYMAKVSPSQKPHVRIVKASVVSARALDQQLASISEAKKARQLALEAARRRRIARERAIALAKAKRLAEEKKARKLALKRQRKAKQRALALKRQREKAANKKALALKFKAMGLADIQKAITKEQTRKQKAAKIAALSGVKNKYMALIQQTIRGNWINQFTDHQNLSVTLRITLDSSGDVISVTVLTSSGNSAFDRQAVLAVKKSSPLPIPRQKALKATFQTLILPFSNQGVSS